MRTIRDALLHHPHRGKPRTADGKNSLLLLNFLTKREQIKRQSAMILDGAAATRPPPGSDVG
jgi:hypothetical protein